MYYIIGFFRFYKFEVGFFTNYFIRNYLNGKDRTNFAVCAVSEKIANTIRNRENKQWTNKSAKEWHSSSSKSFLYKLFLYYSIATSWESGGRTGAEGRSPLGNSRRKMEIWDNKVTVEGLRALAAVEGWQRDRGKVTARLKYSGGNESRSC